MDLDALSAFSLVAAHGGVTQAGRVSRQPKASLSRKIVKLEADLGVRLFERGSRSMHLTEEGELLHARTAAPLGEIEEAAELLREGRAHPRGKLRINVPIVFGQLLMGRLAGEFAKCFPEVNLEVTVDDREVDPAVEGFDVVIRINPSPDAALVGRCFARDQLLIVAAPLLTPPWSQASAGAREAVPAVVRTAIKDTAIWRIAGQDGREIPIRQVLKLPSLVMVRDAVATGIGAAKLPRVLVADDLASGQLVCWGPAVGPPAELWGLHVSKSFTSAKVKAFIQSLQTAFPDGWL